MTYAKTLHSAVRKAASFSGKEAESRFEGSVSVSFEDLAKGARRISSSLGPARKYLRGLYSGGTLAHETLLILRELAGEAYSNTPLSDGFALEDPNVSRGNSVVDIGDEFFTSGRAHPMIDPTLRRLRIGQEAKDPSVAAVLLDVVLGYGSASDPPGALQDAIAGAAGRGLAVMVHVCGTDADPQPFKEQSRKLTDAGSTAFASNALLAAEAALVVGGDAASARLGRRWGELLG